MDHDPVASDINDVNRMLGQLKDVSAAFGIDPDGIATILFSASDDWSFLIKVHALMETAVSQLVATMTVDQRMKPVLEQLSRQRLDQKMNYIKAVQILGEKEIQFIRLVGKMRNHVVHDIRNLDFTFTHYLSENVNDQRQLAQLMPSLTGARRPATQTDAHPRLSVMVGTMFVLLSAYGSSIRADFTRQQAMLDADYLKSVMDAAKPSGD
jgi:hypothetical protein